MSQVNTLVSSMFAWASTQQRGDPKKLFETVPVTERPKPKGRREKAGILQKKVVSGDAAAEKLAKTKKPSKKDRKSHKSQALDPNEAVRTIFVGNLPNTVLKKELYKTFAVFGEIESVRVRSILLAPLEAGQKDRGRSVRCLRKDILKDENASCNGFIVFKERSAAEKADHHSSGWGFNWLLQGYLWASRHSIPKPDQPLLTRLRGSSP